MEWRKLKNIILLILLAVNLFLLVLVLRQEEASLQYAQEALSEAVTVLENSGVSVDARPPEDGLLQSYSFERDLEAELSALTALLGDGCTARSLGGGLYSYSGEKGAAQVRLGGELTFTPEANAYVSDEPERQAAALLDRMGLTCTLLERAAATGDGGVALTYRQSWKDAPVQSCTVIFTYQDGALVSLSGHLLFAGEDVTPQTDAQLLTAPTLLLRFLSALESGGIVCRSVTDIAPAYVLSAGIAAPVTLTPVWCFTTDAGVFDLNVLTGELTRP